MTSYNSENTSILETCEQAGGNTRMLRHDGCYTYGGITDECFEMEEE